MLVLQANNFVIFMNLVASLDAKYLKLSRELSDVEKKLFKYFFAHARNQTQAIAFQNQYPERATKITIELAQLVPAYCTSLQDLNALLLKLLHVEVLYDKGKDFGFFAIIESIKIGTDTCQITIGPHALGFLFPIIDNALQD